MEVPVPAVLQALTQHYILEDVNAFSKRKQRGVRWSIRSGPIVIAFVSIRPNLLRFDISTFPTHTELTALFRYRLSQIDFGVPIRIVN